MRSPSPGFVPLALLGTLAALASGCGGGAGAVPEDEGGRGGVEHGVRRWYVAEIDRIVDCGRNGNRAAELLVADTPGAAPVNAGLLARPGC